MIRSRIVSSVVWFLCGSVVRLFVSAFFYCPGIVSIVYYSYCK